MRSLRTVASTCSSSRRSSSTPLWSVLPTSHSTNPYAMRSATCLYRSSRAKRPSLTWSPCLLSTPSWRPWSGMPDYDLPSPLYEQARLSHWPTKRRSWSQANSSADSLSATVYLSFRSIANTQLSSSRLWARTPTPSRNSCSQPAADLSATSRSSRCSMSPPHRRSNIPTGRWALRSPSTLPA